MSELRHGDLTYRLRGLIFQVRDELKIGWPEEAYHQALVQLLLAEGIAFLSKPRRALVHRGIEVHAFEPDLIVADKPTQYDFSRVQTYLTSLHLRFGLVINFGRKQLQIYGVKHK